MGHQYEQAPAVTKVSEKSQTPIEPEVEVPRPVALDSVRTASLMLRQVQVSGERSYQSGGIGQAIAFTRRLEDVLDEVRALEKLQPSSVSALGDELARVRKTMTRIASRLGDDEKLSSFAADVIAKLDDLHPASATPRESGAAPKDLSPLERTELVRLELAAARTQVGVVLATPPKNVDDAARVCAPLKGHLDEARNAALGIDRFTRGPLFADVDQVSYELDGVERALTMDPKFAWHTAFAGAFDAENRLRSAVGLPARARAYSGAVDPKAAADRVLQELSSAGTGTASSADPPTETPQESVVDVGLNIASAYERMHDEMTTFQSDLSVTDPPALSIGDMLVNAAITILLDVATVGVASFMSDALTKVLAFPGAAAAAQIAAHEAEGIVEKGNVISASTFMKNAAEHEVVRQASINNTIKSRVVGIMRSRTSKAQITPARPSSPTLLNHFVATTMAGITDAKLNSTRLVVGLGEALSQLDPAALHELDLEMKQRIKEPAHALRERALSEYEKLRTENALAARAGHADPLLEAKHLGGWRDQDIAGVLEVGLNVSAANDVTFDYVRLQGSEPAARSRLHDSKQPIRDLGLHRIFHVRFASATSSSLVAALLEARDYLTFGVGATEGLQLETIDEQEWLWLRLLAAGNQVNNLDALALEVRDREFGDANTPEKAAAHLRHQKRIEVTQTWEDLVLAGDHAATITELMARIRARDRVYEEWGFARKVGKGLGVAALFSGPPGTGKTMLAALIAKELGLELYQVDLGKLVSKWIGETEKQLGDLFDAAEAAHAVLLFDEADSLLGKRTEVKSSNDRYANLETNYPPAPRELHRYLFVHDEPRIQHRPRSSSPARSPSPVPDA